MSLYLRLCAWLERRHTQQLAETYSPTLSAWRSIQQQSVVKAPARVIRWSQSTEMRARWQRRRSEQGDLREKTATR